MGLLAATGHEHRYQLCTDEYCDRFPCRVYKEGRLDGMADGRERGFADGYAQGYEAGYRDGYRQGFPDGVAACPRAHGKG